MPIEDNATVNFIAPKVSAVGTFRFNVLHTEGNANTVFTVMLDKRLHTTLLRKNILRKLGYIVPAIKYIKKININFENEEDLTHFTKNLIQDNTLGASARWVVENKNGSKTQLTLRDVAVLASRSTEEAES